MKTIYLTLLLPAFLTVAFVSCKKGDSQNAIMPPPSGKWQETRLELYEDSAGVHLYDTIYTKPFTSYDFAEFETNGTFVTGADHYYYLNIPHQDDSTQLITPVTGSRSFIAISSPSGTKYVINDIPLLLNPGGFVTTDTASLLNSNTLLLHSVFYGHGSGPITISNSYYSK